MYDGIRPAQHCGTPRRIKPQPAETTSKTYSTCSQQEYQRGNGPLPTTLDTSTMIPYQATDYKQCITIPTCTPLGGSQPKYENAFPLLTPYITKTTTTPNI